MNFLLGKWIGIGHVSNQDGAKPLSEAMMVSLQKHIWATRPQWVNNTYSLILSGILPRTIAYDLHKTQINEVSLKTTLLKSLPRLPGTNELIFF